MKKILLLCLSIISVLSIYAVDVVKRPNPPTLLTDFANIFSRSEKAQLEQKLVNYFVATSNQIAVVTVNDLNGTSISDYAFTLGEEWGIGKKDFDNGVVVLLKPKTSSTKGEVFIAVGYGLEGVIPDATTKQIIENEMIPHFEADDMYGGIESATAVLIGLAKGEFNYQQYAKKVKSSGRFNPFIFFILIFLVFPMLFGRRRKSYYSAGGRSSLPFWLAMGMMSGGRRSHSGMFNDFSSGGGSFGGGGSSFGRFGGFGGGGFGGGGAGGSW